MDVYKTVSYYCIATPILKRTLEKFLINAYKLRENIMSV